MSIKDPPDHSTQTCEFALKGGKLPNAKALAKHISEMDVGASLRGIELIIEGEVRESDGALELKVNPDETVAITVLTQKIQWDHAKKRPRPATSSEKSAFTRMLREAKRSHKRVVVTGPFHNRDSKPSVIEVREYRWIP